jgi:hypothetical protein
MLDLYFFERRQRRLRFLVGKSIYKAPQGIDLAQPADQYIIQRGQTLDEVKPLEDHPDLLPDFLQLPLGNAADIPLDMLIILHDH